VHVLFLPPLELNGAHLSSSEISTLVLSDSFSDLLHPRSYAKWTETAFPLLHIP